MSQLMHWWRGASGQWFIHTVYPIHLLPEFEECNYMFTSGPSPDGTRQSFYVGQTGRGSDRLTAKHPKLGRAIQLGAKEVHVHLLAQSKQERINIETDLRNGHRTPLNEQPSAAPSYGGILGYAASPFGLGMQPAPGALSGAVHGMAPPGAVGGIAAARDVYQPLGFGALAAAASLGMFPASPYHDHLAAASGGIMSNYLTGLSPRRS